MEKKENEQQAELMEKLESGAIAVDQPCCSLETQKGNRPGLGRLDLPLRQELQES